MYLSLNTSGWSNGFLVCNIYLYIINIFLYIFWRVRMREGYSFVYVAHFIFLRDVWIWTQRAAGASRRATNIATHLPNLPTHLPMINMHHCIGQYIINLCLHLLTFSCVYLYRAQNCKHVPHHFKSIIFSIHKKRSMRTTSEFWTITFIAYFVTHIEKKIYKCFLLQTMSNLKTENLGAVKVALKTH